MTRRIFVDVSRTVATDFHTGIQKVVRGLFRALQEEGPERGYSVVPVILSERGAYALPDLPPHPHELARDGDAPIPAAPAPSLQRKAVEGLRTGIDQMRHYLWAREDKSGTMRVALKAARGASAIVRAMSDRHRLWRLGKPITFQPDDILLMPDASWQIEPWRAIEAVRTAGGKVVAIWYDVIPVKHPDYFDPALSSAFKAYFLAMLSHADEFVCISETVRNEIAEYARIHGISTPKLSATWPGIVLAASATMPDPRLLQALSRPSVLIVATIEPRKGHGLLLDACERLWGAGRDFNLVFAGRIGWRIRDLMRRLEAHPERGRRLHLFHDLSDAEITVAFEQARVLVFPSQAEGLGLPVIEAEMAGCPAICSDIPVFREIASPQTRFFSPRTAEALSNAIEPFVAQNLPPVDSQALKASRQGLGHADYARRLLDLIALPRPASRNTEAGVDEGLDRPAARRSSDRLEEAAMQLVRQRHPPNGGG